MQDLVAIARIIKPRGLRGEMIAEVLTDFPERFDGLENVVAVSPNGGRSDLKIERFWFQNERVVLKVAGIGSIEAAEPMRGVEICIPEAETVELGEGEFYDWQLEGCEVVTVTGEGIGAVRQVMRTGGTEILVVERDGKEHLIPFAKTICLEVDVERKRILVDPPEGLLEF